METEKLITVKGRGNIRVVPDVTRVKIEIASLFDSYQTAYKMASANLKDVGEVLTNCKLEKSMAKTISFNIEKRFRDVYKNDHCTGEQEFIGYCLQQTIKIDFGMDNVLLSRVIKGLGERLTDMEIRIEYTVKDPRPHQLKMIDRAVKDATEKARIMAQAAGCTLGLVKSINYYETEMHIYSWARSLHECSEAIGCTADSLDITPDDLCAGEDVTVTWYLSNGKHGEE